MSTLYADIALKAGSERETQAGLTAGTCPSLKLGYMMNYDDICT